MDSPIAILLFLLLSIAALIYLIYRAIKQIATNFRERKALGFKMKELLGSGKYTYGHPNIDKPLFPSYIRVWNENIEIYGLKNTKVPYIAGMIPMKNITNITIEDASTIERRVTAARLLMTGVFAFAIKKKKKDELAYLVIEWMDSMWHKEIAQMATFEFSEKGAMERCNKARNELIRLTR